ncbi:IS4 family transposase, partial [Oceanidesulfovibrio indonesiensis]
NNRRSAQFFAELFGALYRRCEAISPAHKFRFKNKLFSLDATTIKLCLSAFPWASFRKNRGGIKLHTLLDHDGYIPAFVRVTNARSHEAKLAKTLRLPKGSIVVFDKGYVSYPWFAMLIASGVHFVTRLKKNASYKVIERRPVNKKQGVTSDQIISIATRSGE